MSAIGPTLTLKPNVCVGTFDPPTPGWIEAPEDGQTYGRKNGAWVPVLPITGGTLTGPLVLSSDAADPLQATTYRQVQSLITQALGTTFWLPLAGGIMTGPLVLSGPATTGNGAVTLNQLNDAIAAGGGGGGVPTNIGEYIEVNNRNTFIKPGNAQADWIGGTPIVTTFTTLGEYPVFYQLVPGAVLTLPSGDWDAQAQIDMIEDGVPDMVYYEFAFIPSGVDPATDVTYWPAGWCRSNTPLGVAGRIDRTNMLRMNVTTSESLVLWIYVLTTGSAKTIYLAYSLRARRASEK